MRRKQKRGPFSVDANGFPTERKMIGGQEVLIHYVDMPESDVTTIEGLRCTTPLRTVIDLAVEVDRAQLEMMIRDCLDRKLFSTEEAMARLAEPDMATHPGGLLLRQALQRC
jgi:hypothetical protein